MTRLGVLPTLSRMAPRYLGPEMSEKQSREKTVGVSMAMGMCFGVAFGAVFGNPGLGLALGVVVGIVVGTARSRTASIDEDGGQPETPGSKV